MLELLILIVAAAVVAGVAALTKRAVSGDGYGRRRPPVSHPPDIFDAGTLRRVN